MKYMGSKQTMLLNGLGEAIVDQAACHSRVVDLFSGSGAVAWFAAERTGLPVLAADLQKYAAVLAAAVIGRTRPADPAKLKIGWLLPVRKALLRSPQRTGWEGVGVDEGKRLSKAAVHRARELCASLPGGIVWNAYGGHYFSPRQAHAFDLMLQHLPEQQAAREVCLAATIIAASRCAAAPGHTAQPFQPTRGALPSIEAAWCKCPLAEAEIALQEVAPKFAQVRGRAVVGDALELANRLRETDLVVLDPPYSAVHYSRFYHVLETIARRRVSAVAGVGRYPPPSERPSSRFSLRTQSNEALALLLKSLASRGCTVVLTFPEGPASNGLSGAAVEAQGRRYFDVVSAKVAMRFSTLGGNNTSRLARQDAHELILTLRPR